MDTSEDTLYLKQYVKQHPDNEMAWYLLGKQYMMLDKEAKANYCFLQAGDIYVAFEKKHHPLSKEPQEMLQQWNKRQRRKRMLSRTGISAVLLLLLAILIPSNAREPLENSELPVAEQSLVPPVAVIFSPQGERKPIGSAWNSLLSWQIQPKLTIAAQMEEEDGWRKWTGRKKVLMTVNRSSESTGAQVEMYDASTCNCTPADSSVSQAKLTEWSAEQEVRWTLASAMYQYNSLYDKWPEKLDQMIKPYPNNVLAGDKSEMRAMFHSLLAAVKADYGDGRIEQGLPVDNGKDKGIDPSRGTTVEIGGDKQWRKPYEVIIDKATHRLAVINGDIIVRSYPVGLGGDETPEGGFYISEKVKNPNGRDDGQFGSRGMTLSNTLYAIHGTDEPESIGLDESHGCIRMNKADVEELYDMVPLGTVVKIKNGTLPSKASESTERFQLEPKQNETNPGKIYRWLN